MMRKKLAVGVAAAMCLTTMMSLPVFAADTGNTHLPSQFVSYTSWKQTLYRGKEDYSSHYVWNTSGFDLWVESQNPSGGNETVNGYAIVPGGEWFVYNDVKEDGHNSCRLNISTSTPGTSGILNGEWSPDSYGNYPVANP